MTTSLRSHPKSAFIALLLAVSLRAGPVPGPGPGDAGGPEGQGRNRKSPSGSPRRSRSSAKPPRTSRWPPSRRSWTTDIGKLKPRDLSDVLKYIPGSMVTFGDKDTYNLKLRGIDANRIALLVDGVPVYEPYFCTFDLKTVSAGGIDTIQVTKGPSSVLYGPNTLGGLVNVITRRPSSRPYLSLTGSYGDKDTYGPGRRRLVRLEELLARGQRPLPGLGRVLLSRSRGRQDPAGQRRLRAPQPQRQALLHAFGQDRDHGQRRDLPVRVRHARRPSSPSAPGIGASRSGTARA